jgi:membrane protease YdiL (CAAX protease family)
MDDSSEDSPLPIEIPRNTWADRILALFEIVMLSGLVSGFLAVLPFSFFYVKDLGLMLKNTKLMSLYLLTDSGITFLILGTILKIHRESLRSLGATWENWKRNLILGLAMVPLFFLINGLVETFFKVFLPRFYFETNPLTEPIHTPQELALFALTVLLAGGIREELQRAFILNRFRNYLGGAAIGLVVWSILFGALHSVQHAQGVVIAVVFGFCFGLAYLKTGSLIAPIVAHGTYDVLAVLAYWFSSSRLR